MRRALVNDIVHSFCFICRQKKEDAADWPFLLLGDQVLPAIIFHEAFDPRRLIPFVAYALANNIWSWSATNYVIRMSDLLRRLTKQEQDYAIHLMERYYGCSNQTQFYHANQPQLF